MRKPFACLLIDDDPEEHELFAMALSEMHHRISCTYFTRCDAASKYLDNASIESPDLVFVDWGLCYPNSNDGIFSLQLHHKLNTAQLVIYTGMPLNNILSDFTQKNNIKLIQKQNSVGQLAIELGTVMY